MVFHNFITHPEAGEETRGYLHGGMFIDFIGQKAPVSVFRLLSLDVLILVIDFVMLGLVIERVKASGASSATDGDTEARDPDRSQDHDAEERGVLRRSTSGDADAAPPHPPLPGEDGVELDDLGPGAARNSLDERLERTGLLGDSGEGRAKDGHFLDSFAGGEAVIMDMGLLDVIRDQWRYSPTGALRRSSPYLPSAETATFLRERFGLRVRPDGRFERVEQ